MKKLLFVALMMAGTARSDNRDAWNTIVEGAVQGLNKGLNGQDAPQFDPYAAQRQQQLNELRRLQEENLRLQNEQLRRQQFMNPFGQETRQPLNCITVNGYTTCN